MIFVLLGVGYGQSLPIRRRHLFPFMSSSSFKPRSSRSAGDDCCQYDGGVSCPTRHPKSWRRKWRVRYSRHRLCCLANRCEQCPAGAKETADPEVEQRVTPLTMAPRRTTMMMMMTMAMAMMRMAAWVLDSGHTSCHRSCGRPGRTKNL